MSTTKKVKSTGRFGSRYGVGIRKRLLKVEVAQRKQLDSPIDGGQVKRVAAGIFYSKKSGVRFAGGAYFPQTLTGKIVSKMVAQRSFLPNVAELTRASAREDESLSAPQRIEADVQNELALESEEIADQVASFKSKSKK